MRTVSLQEFHADAATLIERVVMTHKPVKVSQQSGHDVVVLSVEDWEQTQETLSILQNSSLMRQIAESLQTFKIGSGYRPTPEELHEILSV